MALLKPDPAVLAQGYEYVERHMDLQETQAALLQQLVSQEGPGLQTLAIAEQEVNAGVEVDFPVEGSRRWLIPRLATGGQFAVPAELVALLPFNNRRLGGTIVNTGENNMLLTLADPQTASSQAGLGKIFLGKNGGSWDFRLGSILWCGSICAIGSGGATVATVVEV